MPTGTAPESISSRELTDQGVAFAVQTFGAGHVAEPVGVDEFGLELLEPSAVLAARRLVNCVAGGGGVDDRSRIDEIEDVDLRVRLGQESRKI